jgi:hypothetical protein
MEVEVGICSSGIASSVETAGSGGRCGGSEGALLGDGRYSEGLKLISAVPAGFSTPLRKSSVPLSAHRVKAGLFKCRVHEHG